MKNKKFHLLVLFFTLALGLFFVLTGCPGPMGPAGIQGEQGKDGVDGDDGKDGKDGEKGNPGIDLEYYTVAYNANGGEGEMESSSFPIGFWDRLEANTFTNEGFVFNGWAVTALGPLAFADRDFVRDLSTTPDDTVTLYAVWGEPNTYTVSYNANGGEGNMPPSVFTLGQINILPLTAFTRTGYAFEGWAVEPDGGVIYTDGQVVGYLSTAAGETVYLYSVWKPITYTVIYDANGGNGTKDVSVFTYDEPQALRSNTFTRYSHVFLGWATSAEGQVVYGNGQILLNERSTNGDTITLYAVWEFRILTVIFDPDNGSPTARETVSGGDSVAKPVDPEKTLTALSVPGLYFGTAPNYNYFFTGWYNDDTEWDFDDPVTENMTLTAQWSFIDLSGISAATGDTIVDKAFAYINAKPGEYTLLIGEDIDITGDNNRALNQSTVQLTLLGLDTERKISLASQGRIFTVGGEQYLQLTDISLTLGENITLVGLKSNNESLVCVQNEAALIMQDNSKITGNNADLGGGVYVWEGIFTMQDNASVSGNTATAIVMDTGSGGGVYVAGGTFTMQGDATVSGNEAENDGGGVRVLGSFTMQDNATVSGNKADVGGGVCISGYIIIGTFTMQDNATVSGNEAENDGGGVFCNGFFTMQDNATVSGNTASNGNGGGVWATYFTMQGDATVSNNTAENNGGGVYSSGAGTITMQGYATVSGNTASNGNGGGFYFSGGTFTMQGDATVSGNEAENDGGGVFVWVSRSLTMSDNATVSNNTARNNGGGMNVRLSDLTMSDNATVSNNTARNNGGGMYFENNNAPSIWGVFTMHGNATVSNNTARNNGGGVWGNLTMQDYATVSGNEAENGGGVWANFDITMQDDASVSGNTAENGGGVYVRYFGTMQGDAIVSGNTAENGGGVYLARTGSIVSLFTMQGDATVSGNTAYYGGGVYFIGDYFTMRESAMVSCNKANYGGGVFIDHGYSTFTMQDSSVVSGNEAEYDGGGVYMTGGSFFMRDYTWVYGNTATSCGGGVYMSGGDFRIHGRLILGNDIDWEDDNGAPMKNTASAGAAMYKTGGTARYGGYNHLTEAWSGLTNIPLTGTYFSDEAISYSDGAWAPY